MTRRDLRYAEKRILLILMLLSALLFALPADISASAEIQGKLIPDDAVSFGGHYYKVYDDLKGNKKATWEKASKFCKKRGGHLAVITAKAEDEFVSEYLYDMGFKSVFFGLKLEDGEWKWVNGELFSYSNWGENNPNGGAEEPYGQYYKLFSLRKWNDNAYNFDCTAYVCEWESGSRVSDARVADAEKLIEKDKLDKLGRSYYRVFNNPLTQPEAAAFCEKLGGHLVYVNSAKEQAYVNDLIAQEGKRNMYWTGAVREGTRWHWSNGSVFGKYTNWSHEKKAKNADNAKYAVINFNSDKYDIGSWVAKPAEGTPDTESEYYINYGFVCEWELICSSEEGEFVAHKESEWKTKLESSCEDGGERFRYCLRCGEMLQSEATSPQPHTFERKGLIGKLEIPGYINYVCKKCGTHSHSFEWKRIWILPCIIISYILFAAAYFRAREDFEYRARSEGKNVLTKSLPKKLFVIIPVAALLLTILFSIF